MVFAGVRKQQDAEELRKDSPNIVPIIIDVTKQDQIDSAALAVGQQLQERKLSLLGVVNNAGANLIGMLELQSMERFRQVFDINLFGQLAVSKAFIPLLRRYSPTDRRPRLIFVSTGGAIIVNPGIGAYNASKRGLESLVDSLRGELAPWGIEVTSIIPGPIKTPIQDVFQTEDSDTVFNADDLSHHEELVVAQYRKMTRSFFKRVRETPAAMVDTTAASDRVIESALFDKIPRTRYDAGKGMVMLRVFCHLPDRIIDVMMNK